MGFCSLAGGVKARAVFNGSASDAASPFSFASVPFGTATDRDAVIVAIVFDSQVGSDITDCTIGGATATLIAAITDIGQRIEYWTAAPGGTSGTVDFTVAGISSQFAALGCWSAYGLKSTTPIDTQAGMGAQSLTANPRGFVLAAAMGSDIPAVSWTISGVTQDGSDVTFFDVVNYSRIFASNASPGSSLSYSITNGSAFPASNRALAISLR